MKEEERRGWDGGAGKIDSPRKNYPQKAQPY